MSRRTNAKARIEKKFTKTAKDLLLQLMPKTYTQDDFSFEGDRIHGLHGTVYHDVWVVWDEPDYWTGEQDYRDTFYALHEALIANTTDWDGIGKAHDDVGWEWGIKVDESPFYSPWRLGDASRAQIISHCRKLAAAGVTWG